MRRHAARAAAEQRRLAVLAAKRAATGPRLALVAGQVGGAKVRTAGPLQQISADRCHVADLAACAVRDRMRDQPVLAEHLRIACNLTQARERSELESLIC